MPTQAALDDDLAADLHLSWSEAELPERERTEHVHRLHPYLGKFVPQLVEGLLAGYVRPGGGSSILRRLGDAARAGLESGYHAVGVDVAAFNRLLIRVKTSEYDPFRLESEVRDALRVEDDRGRGRRSISATGSSSLRLRAPGFPLAARRLRARRRPARRPRANSWFRATHDPLRPRLPASSAARAVPVPQAPAEVHARAGGREVPEAVPARHARTTRGVQARAEGRTKRPSPARRLDRGCSRGVVRRHRRPRRRTPVSSTTTSSIATPTRSSGSTTVASWSWVPLPRVRAGARSRATSPASRRCSRPARASSPTTHPCSWS